jgi:hypothetical protein
MRDAGAGGKGSLITCSLSASALFACSPATPAAEALFEV